VDEIKVGELAADWASFPYPRTTQQLGTDWLQSGSAPVLLIPSAATPGGLEQCVLFNPGHPLGQNIRLLEVRQDLFNQRTFSGI
ncbi:MAG: hypothetical protein ACI8WB_006251, partial [Phenylobacterium sp.]